MHDLTSFRVYDYFVIKIVFPIYDSAQIHPLPCLTIKVIAMYLLDEQFATASVTTFYAELSYCCNSPMYSHVNCPLYRSASWARETILSKLTGTLIQFLAAIATCNRLNICRHFLFLSANR